MNCDGAGRRLRHAPPTRRVNRLMLTDADLIGFAAIDRHGPLPSQYLYAFTRHLRSDFSHFQNRLTEFYNGDASGPYLTRPPQQFAGFAARYQHLVYDLAPRARTALAEVGMLADHPPQRAAPFLHRLMTACIGASIELQATLRGLRYIPRSEILSRPTPHGAGGGMCTLGIPLAGAERSALVPDDLFGLEYPGEGFRFFAVEADRNTESIERRGLQQSAFGRKIDGYVGVLRDRLYREAWGLPNLHVLTVTTNATHARNILTCVAGRTEPGYAERFAVARAPGFGANWRVPRELLSALIDEAWETPAGPKRIDRP